MPQHEYFLSQEFTTYTTGRAWQRARLSAELLLHSLRSNPRQFRGNDSLAGLTVLDLGCGGKSNELAVPPGAHLLRYLRWRGAKCLGIDIQEPDPVDKELFTVWQGNILTFDWSQLAKHAPLHAVHCRNLLSDNPSPGLLQQLGFSVDSDGAYRRSCQLAQPQLAEIETELRQHLAKHMLDGGVMTVGDQVFRYHDQKWRQETR